MALRYTVAGLCLALLPDAVLSVPALGYNQTAPTWNQTGSASLLPAANTTTLPLQPVRLGTGSAGRNIAPKKTLNLAWQTPSNDSAVSVGLTMQNTAVVLEDIDDVTAVDCTGQRSVAITFNNTEAFNEALSEWTSTNETLVMITNHMGDCDSELERSFFVTDADSISSFQTNLTIVALAEKSDLVNTASK